MKKISVIIPVYNEEGNITAIINEIDHVFKGIPEINYEIIVVDDGSTDETLPIILKVCSDNSHIFYISLSKNFGKDNAVIAGLQHSDADAVITIDADLQHPPSLIPEFIDYWLQGYEVVYAFRRTENIHASFFTRIRSRLFYEVLSAFSDVQMENGISDFKLIDRKVVDIINQLPEARPFLRGLIKWVGFKQKPVEYEALKRYTGETKYNLRNLINLATHGITSFSTKPLNLAIYLGFFFSGMSLLYIPYAIISLYFHFGHSGWASIIVSIAFFGGLQLMIMGIIGIYLGKTFIQSKQRPRYIIRQTNIRYDSTTNKNINTIGKPQPAYPEF